MFSPRPHVRHSDHQIELANQQPRDINIELLQRGVREVLERHGVTASEVSLAIVDDPRIRQLNRQYLGHDYATDVISFLLDSDADRCWLAGQLIVSADTAEREARQLDATLIEELLLYVVHGSLHLVGYDDHDPDDVRQMRDAEREIITELGFQPPKWLAPDGRPTPGRESGAVDSAGGP